MATRRLTMSQALVLYLSRQYSRRDGRERRFFAGAWGIFGHGNVAGIGQALQQYDSELRYYQCRNEQAQVHTALAYAKHLNRTATFACTASIGPGSSNMVSGAATATVNRLPVLLLCGDIFAERIQAPVLQQLEFEHSLDFSVNDAFKPVSRFWDRIYRPEQLIQSLAQAMRVLTSPADTGAATLCLPQDTQAEAYDYPTAMFEKRVWDIPRNRPDAALIQRAAEWIRASERPLIIAGGGVHYSEAEATLQQFASAHGIPVTETNAGKGALPYDHAFNLGATGHTGNFAANEYSREADLIIGIGTRYSDFTSQSNSAFQNPNVRFININVAEWDSYKQHALPLTGDALVTLAELSAALGSHQTAAPYQARAAELNRAWDAEVHRIYNLEHEPLLSQGEVIGAVNTFARPQDVVLCAAGSLPGDLHKLWRTRDVRGYHIEYGYSCMGYEIAGGMGVKLADPEREVYVMVGDGSYLMMNSEIVTMVQEGIHITIVLLDNHGFASIGGLSNAVGSDGFGTKYRYRTGSGHLDGNTLPIDFAKNCESLGAAVFKANDRASLQDALAAASEVRGRPACVVVETDRRERVPIYESWWDVPMSEVSEIETIRAARAQYEEDRKKLRHYL